jgi:hypothetical protein
MPATHAALGPVDSIAAAVIPLFSGVAARPRMAGGIPGFIFAIDGELVVPHLGIRPHYFFDVPGRAHERSRS